MSLVKIAEISEQPSSSFLHIEKFLKEKNVAIERINFPAEQAKDLLVESREKKFDAYRLSYEMSQLILEKWQTQPAQVQLLGCCDTFLYEEKNYWPRVMLYESLREAIVSRITGYDIKEASYVICDDLKGRVLVSLLLSLGHRRVYLVGEDEDFVQAEVNFLKRFHVGTEILALSSHQLTLQTTKAAIMISTIKYADEHPILDDLVYFNFMKAGGVVLDLNFEKPKSLLLEEAERASLQTLPPTYLSAFYDFSLIQKIKTGMSFGFAEFEQSWNQFLAEKVQNSP